MNFKMDNIARNETMWIQHTKSTMPESVKVIGRVVGSVYIKDIDKTIFHNQVIDITVGEYVRSKDLLQAKSQKWVDIVQGNEYLPFVDKTKTIEKTLEIPMDIKDLMSQVATMAAEQSIAGIKQTLDNLTEKMQAGSQIDAAQVVSEILKKMPQQIEKSTESKVDKGTENVFINIDEGKLLESNIKTGDLGTVTIKQDNNVTSTIQKLKQMKKGDV